MLKKATGQGGFNAYLGTNDAREVMKRMDEGDEQAKIVMEAFIFQVCKDIGAESTVLKGQVDQIIITGGIAYWQYMVDELKKRVDWMAPVHVYPGEDEMSALAENAAAVLKGEIEVKKY